MPRPFDATAGTAWPANDISRRFQLEIPIVIHALGLDLDLSYEAQCLCAFYATAHYLAALNEIDLPRPDYVLLAEA